MEVLDFICVYGLGEDFTSNRISLIDMGAVRDNNFFLREL